jgi:hypothetical protein
MTLLGDKETVNDPILRAALEIVRRYHYEDTHGPREEMLVEVDKLLREVFGCGSKLDHDPESREEPGEWDRKYEVLEVGSLSEHLEAQVLEPSRMVMGRSYVLTPGQRAILREWYSLTPTRTITLQEVALWAGTRYPRRIIIRSDEHVHSGRRHVLVSATIDRPGEFFTAAWEKDQELRDQKPQRGTVIAVPQKGLAMVKVGAAVKPITMVSMITLLPNADVVCKYDPKIEKWKVVRCLDPKEVEQGSRPKRRKQESLQTLSQLLVELDKAL